MDELESEEVTLEIGLHESGEEAGEVDKYCGESLMTRSGVRSDAVGQRWDQRWEGKKGWETVSKVRTKVHISRDSTTKQENVHKIP